MPSMSKGGRISLAGQSIALESRPSKSSLTPSLARIADKDVVVELKGLGPAPFRVGGRLGNVVTNSTLSQIHRGWRILAVNGQRLEAEQVPQALAAAQKAARYSVTFRLEREDADEKERLEKERRRKELLEKERLEQERLDKERLELERLELERLEKEQLDQERHEKERQEERRRAEQAKARQVVEASLEESTGLPPREKAKEPQRALLAALAPAAPAAPKSKGPCDKCDGPHPSDECPHFKKPRDEHKDAHENYQKTGSSLKVEVVTLQASEVRVLPQPGDGSCLFHSLNHGLKGPGATALRAELADYVAAHPLELVSGNPISDWLLWETGEGPEAYARSMRNGSRWGGAIEIALCAQLHQALIEIFERRGDHFVRIAAFGQGSRLRLLYGGRVHYDALEER